MANQVTFITIENANASPALVALHDALGKALAAYSGEGGAVSVHTYKDGQPEIDRLKADVANLSSENASLATELQHAKARIAELEAAHPPDPQPLWRGRLVGDLQARDRAGKATRALPAGTVIDIWGVGSVPGYNDRLFIDQAKNENVWNRNVVRIGTGGGGEGLVLRWPVDTRRVNQFYGDNPATYAPFGLKAHEGIDLEALDGASVYAAADGVVSEVIAAAPGNNYGNNVRVKHARGARLWKTVYAHLKDFAVPVGRVVNAGDLLGHADSTGNSTGSHLHLGIYEQDAAGRRLSQDNGYLGFLDPLPFLRFPA